MDFKEINEKERAYYKQDFNCISTLIRRMRNALIHNVTVKTARLDFNGKWDFNPKISFAYVTLFQAGLKPLRFGSRRSTIEETLNRCLSKIRENKRFSEFDISDPEKCRILLEFVYDRQLIDVKKIHESGNFDEYRFEIGINGIEIKNIFTNELSFYMPTDAIINSHLSLSQVLLKAIKGTSLRNQTDDKKELFKLFAQSEDYEVHLIKTRAFISYRDEAIPIYRGNPLYGEFSFDTLLMQFIKTSDWLVDNMYDDGRFLYYYDCAEDNFKDHEHPNRKPNDLYYNDLRHCGGAISLLKAYLQTKNEKYLNAAKKAIGFTISISIEHEYNGEKAYCPFYNRKVKLGGVGLGLIMLMQYRIISGDTTYDEYIKGYVRHILSRMCPSGELMGYYIHPQYHNGEPLVNMTDQERMETFSFYYPGEALLGLALFMKHFDDDKKLVKEVRKKAEIALDWIVNERPKTYSHLFTDLPSDAWLMQAIDEFEEDEHFRKPEYTNFVYGDAQKMMDRMYLKDDNPYLDYEGGYYYNYGDHYYPDGARSEGLVSAYYLAKRLGDDDFAQKVFEACKKAALSQFYLFNSAVYTFSHKNPARSENGIRFKNTRQWVRVDSVQHVACFFIRLYWAEYAPWKAYYDTK
ncbi:protein containing Six-hairpin glycosidase-like domain protein [bacterium]|nr:protein containing Six-hairpin glycosidase-like domain protein [bacterium]